MLERTKALTDLRTAILELRQWMDKNPQIDLMDQVLIENNIQLLQMIYTTWKSRNAQPAAGE